MTKKTFPQISAHAFEHTLDRAATRALERVPGLDWVIRKFLSAIGEKRLRLLMLASSVRVTERQLPRMYESYMEACRVLDIAEPPELFVAHDFKANAAAIGVDKPFIVVTSTLTDMLTEDEIQCVLGHELGHIMCSHALYTTVLILLTQLWIYFLGIPGGAYALLAIRLALLEWSRKAELSADRAGLLVAQDPTLAYSVDAKLAGGKLSAEISLEEFLMQAKEYEAEGDMLDGVLKLANLVGQTHPFPALRVAELNKWVESGAYQTILDGNYGRRGTEIATGWLDEVKQAATSYKETFDNTKDPLLGSLRDLGGGAASAATDLFSMLRKITGDDPAPLDDRKKDD